MTLIELKNKLLTCAPDAKTCFDFLTASPTTFYGYRGIYQDIALGLSLDIKYQNMLTVENLIKQIDTTIGKTFSGWKDKEGKYLMTASTQIWVANAGVDSNLLLTGVLNEGYKVVLCTTYQTQCESALEGTEQGNVALMNIRLTQELALDCAKSEQKTKCKLDEALLQNKRLETLCRSYEAQLGIIETSLT